jgi:histone-lysine N-methyltransferase SETD1
MAAIKNAHTSSLVWRRSNVAPKDESREGDGDQNAHDPFKELRTTWPGAVDLLENGDWLRFQIEADFMRTRENENAYYSSLAVRRAAIAAETALGPYPDSGGIKQACVRRSHTEDEELRQLIDERVAQFIDPVQLKDEPSWREEAILKVLRRVQSRRVEGRIASDSGCVRCDGVQVEEDAKLAMTAEAVRAGRNRRKGDVVVPRVAASRLKLSTGLASANNRKQLVEEESAQAAHGPNIASMGSITGREISVSVSGSGIHGWGLFADHPFKKGQVVAEYVGELITNAVADAREKMYQERRIQDYQFRVDNSLVIDATMKGGHARYINHNCTPNCIAKIVDGVPPNQHLKRVIIISKRSIEAREEITYDYQFPLELDLDARIPCNCGSRDCRGFMNWDLPEKGSNRVERNQTRGTKIRDRIRRIGRGDARAAAKSEAHP